MRQLLVLGIPAAITFKLEKRGIRSRDSRCSPVKLGEAMAVQDQSGMAFPIEFLGGSGYTEGREFIAEEIREAGAAPSCARFSANVPEVQPGNAWCRIRS